MNLSQFIEHCRPFIEMTESPLTNIYHEYIMRMAACKGTGHDGIPRKAVKLLYISNPRCIINIIESRFWDSSKLGNNISRLY